jgi:DNA adenine methylase
MRYLGGKSKIRKQIAKIINDNAGNRDYFEPFVGGGWILQEVNIKNRTASDGNHALITMYKWLQKGWIPPDFVREEQYKVYKDRVKDENDPLTAFIGFGCCFGGIWFSGYAKTAGRNYAAETKRNLLKQLPLIKDVDFKYGLFTDHDPQNCIVYCDPPYENTSKYGYFKEFDHKLFWETMRKWSENNLVFVSEYQAPDDFECVAEFTSQMGLSTGNGERTKRIEKLFRTK